MTSHSPAFSWNAFLTFSVDASTRVSGPAAARRPVFAARESRVTLAGGTSSVGHGLGRILSFLGPSAPWLSALKESSYTTVSDMYFSKASTCVYLCENNRHICAHVGGRRRAALAEGEAHAGALVLWSELARGLSAEELGRRVMRAGPRKHWRRFGGERARGRVSRWARAEEVEALFERGGRVCRKGGPQQAIGCKT
jgi:hypothetical protein